MHEDADMNDLRILTNHWGQEASKVWRRATTYIAPKGSGFIPSIRVAIQLYVRRLHYDCVVLGAVPSDTYFALMIDCLWYKHPNRFRHHLKRMVLRILSRSVDRFVVWASREINTYSNAFGIPKEKFVFVPYHGTIHEPVSRASKGDYVFSGGNFGRDYATLIKAVIGLPIKVLIACTREELFDGMWIPENVEIRGYSHGEYLNKMAGCCMNVVPLVCGEIHSGGQQTFINSMQLGIPTIVSDPEGGSDYISNGEDGLLVAPGDANGLRSAIKWVLDHPKEAAEMGERAKKKSEKFSFDEHFRKIISVVEEVLRERERKLDQERE